MTFKSKTLGREQTYQIVKILHWNVSEELIVKKRKRFLDS